MHPDDSEFFDWCLKLSEEKTSPILLGVYRPIRSVTSGSAGASTMASPHTLV